MKFKGRPLENVKWKDRVIAHFDDNGHFETNDEYVIQRLKLCDFLPVKYEPKKDPEYPLDVPVEPVKPKKKGKKE